VTAQLAWLRAHDAGLSATRRGLRTAILMPALFAFGAKVLDLPQFATFAAFGSFAMLMFVGYTGTIAERIQAQIALTLAGAILVCLGTLASRAVWLAVAAMVVVGFAVLFAGVVSSVLASSSTSLLLAFVLPVTLPGSTSDIAQRVGGWATAGVVSIAAIALLWPQPSRDQLRSSAVTAARALGDRLDAEVRYVRAPAEATLAGRDAAIEQAHQAVAKLHSAFYGVPYRPTGLSSSARTVVRLVDQLGWLGAILDTAGAMVAPSNPNELVCEVKLAAASVLHSGADVLDERASDVGELDERLRALHAAVVRMEGGTTVGLDSIEAVSSLEPSFRAQEMSYAVSIIADNIGLTAAAERRTWWQRMLGRQPAGVVATITAVEQRAGAHLDRHSVWLHNSVRGAIGLGLAVLAAEELGQQHSFWIVLGTLSVLRSNALSTGQNVLRGLAGTIGGFVVGGLIVYAVGTDTTVLWVLLPFAVLFAGLAPAAFSFAAGQAGFTVTIVVLFNIIDPIGWKVGLIRVEDVAIGCAVSLVVGALFWPRGASAALGVALADAYTVSAGYLRSAVEFGSVRCDGTLAPVPRPEAEGQLAAAAARRLDDAFREFLAERGAKHLQLADVTTLITGVAGLRLAAAAVLDLWDREDGTGSVGDRSAARQELDQAGERVADWFDDLGRALLGYGSVPDPLPRDVAAGERLIAAARRDLTGAQGENTATAVRMIWSGDHLDAARRLQQPLVAPARLAARQVHPHPAPLAPAPASPVPAG
jgi:uncharacterized membrane protein YccC